MVVTRVRRVVALAALVIGTATCGTCGGGNAAQQPIVGYWTWNDGVMQISAIGSNTFEGALVKAESGTCAPKVGHVILDLIGSGTSYTGQDEWYREADCAAKFSTDAKVTLSHGNNTATDCSTGPLTDVAANHNCKTLARLPTFTPG